MTRPGPALSRRAIVAFALTALMAAPATAEGPPVGLPLRVGLIGGAHLTSSEFDVLGRRTPESQLGPAGLFGLRVGWRASRLLAVELAAHIAPAGTAGGGSAIMVPIHADLVVRPMSTKVAPYVGIGGGVYALVGGDAGHDTDALLRLAAGIEWTLERTVVLRLEAAIFATDGVDDAMSFNPAFTVGVDLLGWRERAGTPAAPEAAAPPLFAAPSPTPGDDDDLDDDGVDDEDDACPTFPGLERHDGCPDSDADGIWDAFDACPTRRGLPTHDGCPDADGDGTADRWDACPTAPGPADRFGCPGGEAAR